MSTGSICPKSEFSDLGLFSQNSFISFTAASVQCPVLTSEKIGMFSEIVNFCEFLLYSIAGRNIIKLFYLIVVYMKVKICGIRTVEEAMKVAEMHPDALGIIVGFNQDIAPNVIPEDRAKEIVQSIQKLPYKIDTFLLTDKYDAETNTQYSRNIGNSHIQLLGDVSISDVIRIRRELPKLGIVKVIHVTGYEAVSLAREYEACDAVDALLLDSRIGYRKRGGTGQTHDWGISRKITENSRKPIWLAGGLTVYNLRDAIEAVNPYGVDVETGVQKTDGSKNYDAIREFISVAKLV